MLLEFNPGRRTPPNHGVHIQGRRKELCQDPRGGAGHREITVEGGVIPVGDPRDDHLFEVTKDLSEGLPDFRCTRGKLLSDFSRTHPRHDRVLLDLVQVPSNPIHGPLPPLPKLFGGHISQAIFFVKAILRYHLSRSSVESI
jgi:hypothetical protein